MQLEKEKGEKSQKIHLRKTIMMVNNPEEEISRKYEAKKYNFRTSDSGETRADFVIQ